MEKYERLEELARVDNWRGVISMADLWNDFEKFRKLNNGITMYESLNVLPGATLEEIKSAYRGRMKKLHPDGNPGDRWAEEQTKHVNRAYEVLSDPEERGRYDGWLKLKGLWEEHTSAAAAGAPEDRGYRQGSSEGTGGGGANYDARKGCGVFLGGVELPQGFEKAYIFHNIALSLDGKLGAYVQDGKRYMAAMPKSGELVINSFMVTDVFAKKREPCTVRVKYELLRGKGFPSFFFDSPPFFAEIISGAFAIVGGGRPCLEVQVERDYLGVLGKVSVVKHGPLPLELKLSNEDAVQVGSYPHFAEEQFDRKTYLVPCGIETLTLPKFNDKLTIDITAKNGSVSGDVAHQGRIATYKDIVLDLHSPLAVNVDSGQIKYWRLGEFWENLKPNTSFYFPNAKGELSIMAPTRRVTVNIHV